MTKLPAIGRRTALKTIGAGIVGSVTVTSSVTASRGRGGGPRNVVEIAAKHPDDGGDHYIFDFSTTEIESGWTTFILENQSGSTHFGLASRYEPGAVEYLDGLVEDPDNDISTRREAHIAEVALPFQEAWDPYWNQEIDLGTFFFGDPEDDEYDGLFASLASEVAGVPVGGPGLIQGHHTARTTMYLEPGVYNMECYVLDDVGRFHTDHMLEVFEVTEDESNAVEPNADAEVTINNDGITLDDSIDRPGRYRFGVIFEENQQYDNFMGHDVNLIRLDEGTTIGEGVPETDVNIWVNWLDPVPGTINGDDTLVYGQRGAMTSTSNNPGPSTWLGGVQDIFPEGDSQTAYFEASLKPGDYALVAEIPDPLSQGFVERFTVTPSGRRGK